MDIEKVGGAVVGELVERKTYTRLFWDVMNYQLFEVDNHPFTLSKIVIGLVLLTIGYLVSKRAARGVENRLFGRMQMEESLKYALGRFTFYLFLIFSSLFTLHILNVPITIFAVVGSAIAIGVGFGSQNIIYNFISGMLVMIERPIRLGDFVEIDTIAGTIHEIGIRSTMIITPANSRVIVPNTVFLEKAVTNWTLGDQIQAGTVRVGVGYDSDVELVKQTCLQAAQEVETVLKDQLVTVVFADFGDNALIFDLNFSCIAGTRGERRRVESEVRFKLHNLFQQKQISFPFPQRDVHLDSAKPIEVRVTNS